MDVEEPIPSRAVLVRRARLVYKKNQDEAEVKEYLMWNGFSEDDALDLAYRIGEEHRLPTPGRITVSFVLGLILLVVGIGVAANDDGNGPTVATFLLFGALNLGHGFWQVANRKKGLVE